MNTKTLPLLTWYSLSDKELPPCNEVVLVWIGGLNALSQENGYVLTAYCDKDLRWWKNQHSDPSPLEHVTYWAYFNKPRPARKSRSSKKDGLTLVKCKDLVKGRTYWLTGDYWPYGGKPVKVTNFFPAKEEWPGTRGQGATIKTDDGTLMAIHPRAGLFAEDPCFSQT